jgi:hypothetical protein
MAMTATTEAVIGAAIGGALAWWLKNGRLGWVAGGAVLGAVAGTVANTAMMASNPPALPPTPPKTVAVQVTPGSVSAFARMGDTISLQLPNGGQWTAGGNNPTSGSAWIAFVYQGPGSINLTWTDINGNAQTTTISVTTAA